MSRIQDIIQRSTRALQPAATAVSIGTLYYVTDEKIMERSTGAAWQAVQEALTGDSGSGGTKGLCPAPAAGDAAAGKYLKASGAWAALPASAGWDSAVVKNADESRDNQGGTFVPATDSTMRVVLGVGTHWVKVVAIHTQSANNGDLRWSLKHSGTVTAVTMLRSIFNGAGTSSFANVTALPDASTDNQSSGNVGIVQYEGRITVSVSGNFEFWWSGDDGTTTCTLLAGSRIEYKSF